ncbi:hypothetical protein ACF06D_08745 [Streptomyces griseoluteus]|uniref:hypothetical protein n=1 Tax=Streptomyces griseoluteus TaxID=29306 RepID=UPI0036FECEDF
MTDSRAFPTPPGVAGASQGANARETPRTSGRTRRTRPAADGFPVTDELLARLSLLQYDHINSPAGMPPPGLRRLRIPHSDDETDDGEDE